MADELRGCLTRQLDIAWMLTEYHFQGLTTEECLWRPAKGGLHVHPTGGGRWRADWPDREGYDLGPPSIGWLTWHMAFWWSMVLDHSFGDATLTREDVYWPGSADAVKDVIGSLHARWRERIAALDDEALRSPARTKWPFQDRPFGDVIAWATVELTKNASELGYARFLYATRGS